jgi:hypothetical protein
MSTTSPGPANGQFLRKANLVVSKGLQGMDLSQLRFRFEVRASDAETPNTATIRVYNASDNTAQTILAEYDTVTLQAGYENGNFGIIFQGDIKQFRTGRERNVDSYLDILAADGDEAYNFGVVNQSLAAGFTAPDELSTYAAALGIPVDINAEGFLTAGGIVPSPRGKVMWGMARAHMRTLASKFDCRWSIQNGQVTLIPNTGYLPGKAVQINSASGMLGTPEQTDNGISIRCYLNPLIKIGQAVQINNKDINQTVVKQQFFPSYTSQYYPATVTNDGFYRVLVAEHAGDTRGNDWYTELTCLDIDISSPAATSVLSHG